MLDVVRKYSSSKWAKAIFLAIAASFFIGFSLLGAVWRSCGSKGLKGNIARVGKWYITPKDMATAYSRLNMIYSSNPEGFPENMTEGALKDLAIGFLTNIWLLAQRATELKWKISDEELNMGIRSVLGLRTNIPKKDYLMLLGRNRLFPEEFEKQVKYSLLAQKITETLKDAILLDEETLWEEYKLKNQKISLYFVKFDVENAKKEVNLSLNDLKRYYDDHKNEFMENEKRVIRYVIVKSESAEEIYNMVKEKGLENTCEEKKLTCSETPPLEKDVTPPSPLNEFDEFMKSAFSLGEGEIGEPLHSGEKTLIFKVHGILKPEPLPFDNVKDRVREKVIEIKARELAEKKAKKLIELIMKSREPHKKAKDYGYKVEETGWISFGDSNIKEMGGRSEVAISAWKLTPEKRVLENPVFFNNAYYLVILKEKVEPTHKEFEENIEKIKEEVFREYSSEIQNQLIINLYSKYPVNIDEDAVKTLDLSY